MVTTGKTVQSITHKNEAMLEIRRSFSLHAFVIPPSLLRLEFIDLAVLARPSFFGCGLILTNFGRVFNTCALLVTNASPSLSVSVSVSVLVEQE